MQIWQRQLIRYGVVGLGSTTVHVLVAFCLLEFFQLSLVASNTAAFFSAVSISYFGNALWSFDAGTEVGSMARFIVVSAIILLVIVLISEWVTNADIAPVVGIPVIAVIIPLLSFLLQKLWVFDK